MSGVRSDRSGDRRIGPVRWGVDHVFRRAEPFVPDEVVSALRSDRELVHPPVVERSLDGLPDRQGAPEPARVPAEDAAPAADTSVASNVAKDSYPNGVPIQVACARR